MKVALMNNPSIVKKSWPIRFTALLLVQFMLIGCGGGGGSKDNKTTSNSSNIINLSSSIGIMSSPGVSSASAARTSVSSNQLSSSQISIDSSSLSSTLPSSQSSLASSNQTSSISALLVDASNQFTATINENFYVFRNPSEPHLLRYLPKQLALSGLPGVASIQRTNKVSSLQKIFLELSSTDWISANQIAFSSRFTLDVDLQQLEQESEAAGYTELADLNVKPPVMMLEQRYTTSIPLARIQIECKNLTLIVNDNDVTLHDCNLVDANGVIATQTINNIAGFRYEQLTFNPEAISGNKSLRGTFSIDYTLPGTRKFDDALSTNNGDLQHTWQLYFNWPLAQTTIKSTTVTVNWKALLADFNTQVSAEKTRWDENIINVFIASAINSRSIIIPATAELTPALNSAIISYLKQELFVAIYSENGVSPLMWAPKLRLKNIDQQNTQQVIFRYFDSESPIISKINLSCLTTPDTQNNIYKSPACASNSIP